MRPRTDRAIWRPYTQERIAAPPLKLARAEGAHLITESGRRIFDGISSWWLITHGHCRPEIAEAVARQAMTLDQAVFANFTHEPAEELARRLLELNAGKFQHVFFSDNGSTAVEVALKMAYQACAQSGQAQRNKFLAFAQAYHGDTAGAMSVSARGSFTKPYERMTFEILRAPQPLDASAPAEQWTAGFKKLLEEHHRELAAVIIEPLVQGAAGMIVWPDQAVREIAHLCREYGVYLIFDEVMTGFGRTGTMFAADRLGASPDFMCLSKGLTGGTLPLSVTLTTAAVYERFLSSEKSSMFFHGHSFTGNALACAAAVANLELFETDGTSAKIEAISRLHRERLDDLCASLPVKNPRLCGTIAAFELDHPQESYTSSFGDSLRERALEKDLFLRPLGNTLYLLPCYASSAPDLHRAWDALKEIAGDLG